MKLQRAFAIVCQAICFLLVAVNLTSCAGNGAASAAGNPGTMSSIGYGASHTHTSSNVSTTVSPGEIHTHGTSNSTSVGVGVGVARPSALQIVNAVKALQGYQEGQDNQAQNNTVIE